MVETGRVTERDGFGYYSDGALDRGEAVDTYRLKCPHPRGYQYVQWYWYKKK